MPIEEIEIKNLKMLEKNPRKITKQAMLKLVSSLEDDPSFIKERPVLVNLVNGVYEVYGGNQRVKAAKKLKWKTISCAVSEDLPEERIKERIIKDNQTYGEFDYSALASDWDVDMLLDCGVAQEQLSAYSVETISPEQENEVLESKKDEDASTNTGDLYELNDHRLLCGDSANPDCVSKLLEDKQSLVPHEPILMVTDPPYGVNYDPSYKKTGSKYNNFDKHQYKNSIKKVKNDDQVNWSLSWHLFPGNIAYVWHASTFTSEVQKSLIEAEFEVVSNIIWVKQHGFNRGDYHWYHETCLYAVRKGQNHNWQGSNKERTVWEIDSLCPTGRKKESFENNEKTSHSTQKPLECMAKPIRNNTCEGEGVYDPFIGSGTTLIACEQLKRNCFGIEISPAYCDIVVDRWVKHMKRNNKPFKIKKNGEEIDV